MGTLSAGPHPLANAPVLHMTNFILPMSSQDTILMSQPKSFLGQVGALRLPTGLGQY